MRFLGESEQSQHRRAGRTGAGTSSWLLSCLLVIHTEVMSIFCEEGGPCPKVDAASDDIAVSEGRTVVLSHILGLETVTVVAVVTPGLWFPSGCSI